MSYWQYYQPNPHHDKVVGDCTIRAMTKALDMPWDDVYCRKIRDEEESK